MKIVTIDFETEGIVEGSATPPKPIGVAIKYDGGNPYYIPFGHCDFPESKNYTLSTRNINKNIKNIENFEDARQELNKIIESDAELLFHNAKFDLRVMKHYFGLKITDYKRIHDTMLLLFLYDPNQDRLGLKESAHRLLGIRPTDKETLEKYMIDNQKDMGIKTSTAKKKHNYYMKMLKYAPADVVGKYACNDVEITYKLFVEIYTKRIKDFMLVCQKQC